MFSDNENRKDSDHNSDNPANANAPTEPAITQEDVPSSPGIDTPAAASHPRPNPPTSKDVFVICDPDSKITKFCADYLAKHGLNPIYLHDPKHANQTWEQNCLTYPRVSFAVVILSGEEFVYSKTKKPDDAKLRSPQNLVFALGFFLAKLGRQNAFVLYQEQKSFLLPTPYHHAIYTPLDSKGLWQQELTMRLKNCGYQIN